jgi:hypothetical protein
LRSHPARHAALRRDGQQVVVGAQRLFQLPAPRLEEREGSERFHVVGLHGEDLANLALGARNVARPRAYARAGEPGIEVAR